MAFIVKNTTLVGPLDLLAPHSCRGCGHIGSVLCDRCKKYIISGQRFYCPNCKKVNLTADCPHCTMLPPIYVVGERVGLLDKVIQDYKYHSVRALALPLAEMMNQVLPKFDGLVSIVPLPTIDKHIRERAFDHTDFVARKIAKLRGRNYRVDKILVRAKDTVQVGANQTVRARQALAAYSLDNDSIEPDVTYLLFDDIWTTGSSMKTALQKIQSAGAKKVAVALLAVSRID